MRFADLISKVPSVQREGSADAEVTAIADDSRKVGPGTLFVARGGARADGGAFVADAIKRGAVAIVAAPGVAVPANMPVARAVHPSLSAAHLAHALVGGMDQILALEADLAAEDFPRRLRQQAHDGHRGDTFPATRLTDDADCFPLRDGKGNLIHGAQHPTLRIERGDELVHFQQLHFAHGPTSVSVGSGAMISPLGSSTGVSSSAGLVASGKR